MTLVEVLVASSIMVLFVLGVSQLLVTGYRANARRQTEGQSLRRGMDALNQVGRELRLCEQLINPYYNWSNDGSYVPEKGVRFPFIFRRYSGTAQSEIVVAYEWDRKSSQLERVIYPKTVTPQLIDLLPSIKEESRALLSPSIQSFKITRLAAAMDPLQFTIVQFLQIDLTVLDGGVEIPLRLAVRTHGF